MLHVACISCFQEENDDEMVMDVMMESETTPALFAQTSHASLYLKVRAEEMKLLLYKEKLKKEEGELLRVQEKMKNANTGDMPQEVEQAYVKLMKKMRPIAPKKPQKKKLRTLEELIVHMRKERHMSEEASIVLLNLFADVPLDDHPLPPASREGLQCFAQYMTFYNTESYENLSSAYDISLPTLSSIRTLFQNNLGEPGWSHEAFSSLKDQAKRLGNNSKLLCSLLVAEMSIKRKEEWDGKKIRGYVDCGPFSTGAGFDMDVDGLPTARSTLVIMVVPLDPQQLWRVPVAYFFINRLSSAERANVIREAILRLHAVGAVVLSVTCDVFNSDKIFLDSLGVSIDLLPHICPYFVHPADPLLRVHVIFDHCSLLTSVQNMWATSQGFQDGEGRSVNWKFVSELMKLQETQAGSYTQSFDAPQWCWDSVHIKNRLMAQLFSTSTADAIEYCSNELKLTQFDGCEGTVNFIRVMSKISKLLKYRRFLKSRTNGEDEASLRSEYLEVLDYLFRLQDEKEKTLHSASSGSIRFLYQTLMSIQELLRQVPGFSAHCVSLDEAELLFYNIRSYMSWGSIPTARQFTIAFTTHVEKYGYFTSWSCAQTNSHWWVDSLDVSVARKEGRLVSKPEIVSPCIPSNFETQISFQHVYPAAEYKSLSACNFVAICIVKSLAEILHCDACLLALQEPYTSDNPLLLLLRKTCGAVVCPSKDVLTVCASAEHHLQLALKTSKFNMKSSIFEWRDETFITHIGTIVMREMLDRGKLIFSSLQQHHIECAPDASHLYRLVRGISCCYVTMRLRRFKSWCPV